MTSYDLQNIAAIIFKTENTEHILSMLTNDCSDNLPFLKGHDDTIFRVQLAVLKLSDGNFEKLSAAIKLAQNDWRDVLIAADFADDIRSHELWIESLPASADRL